MARFFPDDFRPEELNIEIEEVFPNCTEVFCLTSDVDSVRAEKTRDSSRSDRQKIACFNGQNGLISIWPIITLPTHSDYFQAKYANVKEIIVEVDYDSAPYDKEEVVNCLQLLPSGFIKDVRYGLGLIKEYQPIIWAIEQQTQCAAVWIGREGTGHDDCGNFHLNLNDFDEMRRLCNRITDRTRKAARITKAAATYNHIAILLGNEQKPLPTNNDTLSKMLQIKISDTDRQAAMRLVSEDSSAVKQTDPLTLAKLKNDIELVSLERLISTYEELLSKHTREDTWQRVFNENPFILSLAFGYPAIKISDQASVGGRKLSGDGEKITDYLIKNSLTDNLALIEIKKPSSALLNKRMYRGSVYSASAELTGSVTQVLDQCYQLQQNIPTIKHTSRIHDIESYAVHCILVIGIMPSNEDEKKSFEIYRRNSKNVHIITFDELLTKIKQLHAFLGGNCDN